MMLGSKGLLPPTDAYELLRCKAAPAILKHSESADSKCNYSEPHSQNRLCEAFLNNMLACYLLMVVTSLF